MSDAPQNTDEPGQQASDADTPDFGRGLAYLKGQVKTLPHQPGVYRMFNAAGESLYVGKARHLARRVTSYTQPNRLSNRLIQMVSETTHLEITVTTSEVEALLLEANLIKKLRPRYNILLKDDKSFAHILLTGEHDFPQMTKHRGAQNRKGVYFGPFASAGAVNRTLSALSRAFLLRTCSDAMFEARSRPCLQYQIKRCSAPCVDYVSRADYAGQVAEARAFLSGQSDDIQRRYAAAMQEASDGLEFEMAALWRNRIRALTAIQANQDVNLQGLVDCDIIAVHRAGGRAAVQIFFIRGGANFGNTAYFPKDNGLSEQPAQPHPVQKNTDTCDDDLGEIDQNDNFWADTDASRDGAVIAAFISQFYDERLAPKLILVSALPDEASLLAEALSLSTGQKVEISQPQRGTRRKLVEMAHRNAKDALSRKLA
ncbi:MAG: excinuclease ABC subunit UvrC, partial [Pseudomonadota bacterium]|nr:excinuclease ABC subunit UvrC [Pseudomonadota bacterium]